MPQDGDPEALGQLLRSRRDRLLPGDVGLPAGQRRRTAGLRREEVAQLANLSTTYYTFLEQGRPVRPSEQVLDALAAALRMSPTERRYLQVLAYGADGTGGGAAAAEHLEPGVVDLVHRLDPHPTYVKGSRWDLLVANAAARELFSGWSAMPADDRNLVRWMFTSQQAREVYLDWEPEARAMLGRFRLAAARHPEDREFGRLVALLHAESEHVREWWPRHDVVALGGGTKKLRHPSFGPVSYTHVVLEVAGSGGQTLVTYAESQPAG